MDHRTTITMAGIAIVSMGGSYFGSAAVAQEKTLKEQIVGAWALTSAYDDFAGKKVDTWGPNVRGTVIFDKSGQFEFLVIAANRPKPTTGLTYPLGPALGHFGTYEVDEANKTFTYHIDRSTFPDLDGTDAKRIVTVRGDEMTYKATAPIPSPDGPFVPHLEWKRTK
jgi:hypothetical protein